MTAAANISTGREITRGESFISLKEKLEKFLEEKSFAHSEDGQAEKETWKFNVFGSLVTSQRPYWYRCIDGVSRYYICQVRPDETTGIYQIICWDHNFIKADTAKMTLELVKINLNAQKPDFIGLAAKGQIG